MNLGETIEVAVRKALENHENYPVSPLDALVTFGELVDRLAIVNIKLYHVKHREKELSDPVQLAAAAKEDILLCKERSVLKNCINEKIVALVSRVAGGAETTEPAEVKTY